MKVSVIVPFYKGISFLEDCLQSLVEQSYKDMEVILVCDRSEDDVAAFIEPYKKNLTIKLLQSEDKHGVAAARNYGLSKASGEYVFFLDSDDYIANNTLELMVSKAEEMNADFVYGKKIWTWFKRSIFLANFNTEDIENEKEEEDGEGSSMDSAELNLENGGESVSGNSLNDDQLLNDDTQDEEEGGSRGASSNTTEKQRLAYDLLISQREGVRNITILHQLIRRSIIENNNFRFNESIKFLSDYPFLLQVLSKAKVCEYVPQAAYMKRNHNDATNLPALSQMKGSKSFGEYAQTYRYAVELIVPKSELRNRLDMKIIHYCVTYFAPKLRTNHDDVYRTKKFDSMHQFIANMDADLLKTYKGYNRKLLKAFYVGDINKAEKTVKLHLKWMKLKRILKNKRTLSRFLYERFFLKRPVKENWVICESFFGKNYSDSPKYIYEYLQKNYPGKYRFVWVIDKKHTKIPYRHTKVKRFSFRYSYFMARSKYFVFNVRQPDWIRKRKKTVFLETWHGTPLKKLVFDQGDISSASPRYKDQFYNQSRAWDYLIAANQFSSDTFRRCFMFNKTMLDTGYPRNDILHDPNKDEIADQIKKKLGIPKDKKTILYAPTWRDDEFYTKGRYKFSLKLDLRLLKEKLGNEYVIILRTHYFIADSLDVTGLEGFAYNCSKYDDISELYLISDILITDYSSVFFDYANLKRPMLFYTYDLEKYRDVLRGFYIDIEEELPGPMLFTSEEIVTAVNNINQIEQKYRQKYDVFYDKYNSWEDGNASKRVVEAVFK
ncbi:MAG TPA: bifunctional glycosyltransferase family 2 protein/CDP-glycerol:glycerophosphate glycerophosphotransferase [Mobilitalea sp.]|nr:bifunctional glycosyltransferase family 2 protein/CDP-glycerol:glycerophosphate glycerophosphotransferase [Mobilitalea sp.]